MSGGGGSAPGTITLTPATACGKGTAYTPIMDSTVDTCGPCIRLRLIPVAGGSGSGGGKTITFMQVGCGLDGTGKSYIEFASSDPLLCTGTVAGSCGENLVRVRMTCKACAICTCSTGIAWTAAGWYCTDGNGCVYYATDPGASVKLCGGPFATQNDCETLVWIGCPTCSTAPRTFCVTGLTDTFGNFVGVSLALAYIGDATWEWAGRIESAHPGTPPAFVLTRVTVSISACFAHATIGGVYPSPVDPTVEIPWNTSSSGAATACELVNGATTFSLMCRSPGPGDGGIGNNCFSFTTSPAPNGGCEENPPSTTYNCVAGTCVAVYDGTGEYATAGECAAACGGVVSYNCVSGSCVAVSGSGGTYATLAACQANCTGAGGNCGSYLTGKTGTLVITGGTYPGTYTAVWSGTTWIGSVGGVDFTVEWGTMNLAWNCSSDVGGGGPATSTTCGPPAIFTFNESTFLLNMGGATDVTITT